MGEIDYLFKAKVALALQQEHQTQNSIAASLISIAESLLALSAPVIMERTTRLDPKDQR